MEKRYCAHCGRLIRHAQLLPGAEQAPGILGAPTGGDQGGKLSKEPERSIAGVIKEVKERLSNIDQGINAIEGELSSDRSPVNVESTLVQNTKELHKYFNDLLEWYQTDKNLTPKVAQKPEGGSPPPVPSDSGADAEVTIVDKLKEKMKDVKAAWDIYAKRAEAEDQPTVDALATVKNNMGDLLEMMGASETQAPENLSPSPEMTAPEVPAVVPATTEPAAGGATNLDLENLLPPIDEDFPEEEGEEKKKK